MKEKIQKEKRKAAQKKISVKLILGTGGFMLLAAYLMFAAFFQGHFFFHTDLNGVDVSGKSAKQVKELITQEINAYGLKLSEREEKEEKIRGTDISLAPEFGDSIEKLIEQQNTFGWVSSIFSKQQLEEETMVNFDEKKLVSLLKELECMQPENQKAPVDARYSDYSSDGYSVIPEEYGTTIKEKKLIEAVKDAVSNLEEELSLEEAGCYQDPKVKSDSKELIALVEQLNSYTGVKITYEFGDKNEVLDGSTTHNWIKVDGFSADIEEEPLQEYVKDLASRHNTAFRKRTLKTSYGTEITLAGGDYGWKVDKEGEALQLVADIKGGKDVSRELVYSQRANSFGEHDYGDTYVEINLTAQHLFFYKNGSLLVEADFVSGNLSRNYDTPSGAYMLTYKERNATLKGENYASDVDYWMPFCNNVGMHDASWRSSFGGNIYKTNGSHGCVNLPPSAAKKIFENIEKGDPVLVYTLPGTESAAAAAQDASNVTNMINGIGEVTLESETAIVTARKMYNLLSDKAKGMVGNYDILVNSEAVLAQLKAEAAAAAAAQPPAQ